jgi:hypothetical protein
MWDKNNLMHNVLIVVSIIGLLLVTAFYAFIMFKKHEFDFRGTVISWILIYNMLKPMGNTGDVRLVGRVMPYNKRQMRYNGKMITQSNTSVCGMTLISGSIGSGKTYSMINMIKHDLINKRPVVFTEFKGDKEVTEEVINFAKEQGYKKIYYIEPEHGLPNFKYDPLIHANDTSRVEALMNMRAWDISGADAHYKTSTQLLLQKLVGEFTRKFDDYNKNHQNRQMSFTENFYKYIKTYDCAPQERDAYNTVEKLLELLLTSALQSMFQNNSEGLDILDFDNVDKELTLVVISMKSSNKSIATSFSSLLFRDLLDRANREPFVEPLMLYIDEFSTLENPFIIRDILERGRSGGIAATWAVQDLNQIVMQTNSEAYLQSMLGTINTFNIYNGVTKENAKRVAGVQIREDIELALMNLRKPGQTISGEPTAMFISKYPVFSKKVNSEVWRYIPYSINNKNTKAKEKPDFKLLFNGLSFNNKEEDGVSTIDINEKNDDQSIPKKINISIRPEIQDNQHYSKNDEDANDKLMDDINNLI